jgi:hypothetical protein
MASNSSYASAIKEHYSRCWSADCESIKFDRGPIDDLPSAFRILRFRPRVNRTMWTYATQCMSRPVDGEGVELHMFTDGAHDEVVELLVATAHYHRTGMRLGLGHTVNFGQPWIAGSQCDRGLLSLPYLDGPALEWLERDGVKIHFLWLVPVTGTEVAFAHRNGIEALERRFEASNFNYVDPLRPAVVP